MRTLSCFLIAWFLVSCQKQETPKDASKDASELEGSLWVCREIDDTGEEVKQGLRFQSEHCEWIIYNSAEETKVLDQLKYVLVSDVITFSSLEGGEDYTGKFSNDRTSFIVVEGEDSVEFVKQTRQAEQGDGDQTPTAVDQ